MVVAETVKYEKARSWHEQEGRVLSSRASSSSHQQPPHTIVTRDILPRLAEMADYMTWRLSIIA